MITASLVLLAISGACFLVRAIAGPSLADRVIGVDGLVATIVGAIVINAMRTGSGLFLGVAVVVAFVGFVGTIAGARFVERRGG